MVRDKNELTFDSPAVYQIRVEGCLQPRMSERLEGMAIRSFTPTHGPVITILKGELTNQAALAGVLNSLYDLHLPVLLVKRLAVKDQRGGQ